MPGSPLKRQRREASGGAPPATAASADLQTLIASLGGDAEGLELWRYSPTDNTPYFVCPTSMQGFDLDWVRRKLGGGRFAVDAVSRKTGVRKVVRRFEFAIEGTPKPFTEDAGPLTGAVQTPATNTLQDLNTALVTTVVAALGGVSKSMLEMSKIGQRDSADPMTLALLKIVTDMAMGKNTSAPQSFAEQIAALKTLYDLSETLRPESSPPLAISGEMGTFAAALQTIGPLANAIASKLMAAPAGQPAPPNVPAVTAGDGAAPPAGDAVTVADQISQLVPYLIDKARKGADPEVVAGRVVEELAEDLPGAQFMLLATMARSDSFVPDMLTKMGGSIPHELHEWATAFLTAARNQLTNEGNDDGEETPTRTTGD